MSLLNACGANWPQMVNRDSLWERKRISQKNGISLALADQAPHFPTARSSNCVHLYPNSLPSLIIMGEPNQFTSTCARNPTLVLLLLHREELLLLLFLSPRIIECFLSPRSFTLAYAHAVVSP